MLEFHNGDSGKLKIESKHKFVYFYFFLKVLLYALLHIGQCNCEYIWDDFTQI